MNHYLRCVVIAVSYILSFTLTAMAEEADFTQPFEIYFNSYKTLQTSPTSANLYFDEICQAYLADEPINKGISTQNGVYDAVSLNNKQYIDNKYYKVLTYCVSDNGFASSVKGGAVQLRLKKSLKIHQIVVEARRDVADKNGYFTVWAGNGLKEDLQESDYTLIEGNEYQYYPFTLDVESEYFTFYAPLYEPDAAKQTKDYYNKVQVRSIIFYPEGTHFGPELTEPKDITFEDPEEAYRELILEDRDNDVQYIFVLPKAYLSDDETKESISIVENSVSFYALNKDGNVIEPSYLVQNVTNNHLIDGFKFKPAEPGQYIVKGVVNTDDYKGEFSYPISFYPSFRDARINWTPVVDVISLTSAMVAGLNKDDYDGQITPYENIGGHTWVNAHFNHAESDVEMWYKTDYDENVDKYWEDYNKKYNLPYGSSENNPAKMAAAYSPLPDDKTPAEIGSDMKKYGGRGIQLEGGNVLTMALKSNGVVSPEYKLLYGPYVADDPLGVQDLEIENKDIEEYFTLQGVKTENPGKGLYIVKRNGRYSKQVR